MPIPKLLAFFAAGSALVLLFYILQTLDRIHATLVADAALNPFIPSVAA